jgi:hypothetical protein
VGDKDITITPVEATLTLTASRYVVTSGQAVTFSATVSPAAVDGIGMPYTVQQWTWSPDSGGSRTPCGAFNGNPATCTFTPNESGTLQIQEKVNGVILTTSVHIRLLCVLTGDPILDSLPMLDALKAAEDSSGDYNVEGNQADRREWFTQLHCDASGDCSYQLGMGNSPCGATPPVMDTTNLVAAGHTHPFWPVERATPPDTAWVFRNPLSDAIPDICKDSTNMSKTLGNAPWPSIPDFGHAGSYNIPPFRLREYVLDPKYLYVIPDGDMTVEERSENTDSIPRVQGTCRII